MSEYTDEQIEQNRRAWIAALRSGDYRQGQGQLHDPVTDTYCCLGVACRVLGMPFETEVDNDGLRLHGVRSQLLAVNDTLATVEEETYLANTTLPREALRPFGLYDLNPVFGGKRLAVWNDDENASFDQIADLLERGWGYA